MTHGGCKKRKKKKQQIYSERVEKKKGGGKGREGKGKKCNKIKMGFIYKMVIEPGEGEWCTSRQTNLFLIKTKINKSSQRLLKGGVENLQICSFFFFISLYFKSFHTKNRTKKKNVVSMAHNIYFIKNKLK